MSKKNRIAVLMPCFNPGPDLQGTLDSLRLQTVGFTLFLVDDGSSPCPDYASLCEGIDLKLVMLPENRGISAAMNAGLKELLTGGFDFVARIDAGDFCTPDRFAKQVAYLDSHPDIDILGSAAEFRLFDSRHKLTGTRLVHYPVTPELATRRLYFNSSVSHPTMMVRTKAYAALGAYSEAYPAAEDFELLWRAQLLGFKAMSLPDMLLIKEETPDSISHKRRRMQVLSRMRIQWAHRNLTSYLSWAGMAKSLVTFVLPSSVITTLKFMLAGR